MGRSRFHPQSRCIVFNFIAYILIPVAPHIPIIVYDILQYVQTSANIWSFILSTPDTNSYIAMGFSATGGMVGSSAIVGWVASRGASGGIKQYYLGGVTPNQVMPDKGNLQVIGNSTFITLQYSRLYMVFQLETTEPLSWLIFATGSTGIFPAAPSYALTKHLDRVSTRIDYSKG